MKLSIIVPVYNTQQYLKNCVESILSQPFKDYELLLVNDASSDHSLEAAHALERQDSRITVYDKPHGGLGDTRNFGAQRAQGEYLLFIDSDDWIGEDTLFKVMEPTLKAQADLTVFNFIRENETDSISRLCTLPIHTPTDDAAINEIVLKEQIGPDAGSTPWRSVDMLGCAWRRLYRREWFLQHHLSYPDEQKVMLEDRPVSIMAHFYSKKTLFLDVPLYHYRYNPDSLSTRYRPEKMQKLSYCFQLVESFLKDKNINGKLRDRHMAWYLRNAAHSALVNVFSTGNKRDKRGKKAEIQNILTDPLLKRAAKSRYLCKGTAADRVIYRVISSGSVGLVYTFYRWYADKLRQHTEKQ
ncbi:glycosyltransferase family 2 protein [Caproicibacterium lactatifermentans]|uniref:glycosyltransferase family 2 protein n=1 Tax=Caproicibacterium lactatifermentans TaxID=2666138 RepID=UPI00157AF76B|nr:glycosyltransferase family 2 protein [Caproicibacterium lactatifermentans]